MQLVFAVVVERGKQGSKCKLWSGKCELNGKKARTNSFRLQGKSLYFLQNILNEYVTFRHVYYVQMEQESSTQTHLLKTDISVEWWWGCEAAEAEKTLYKDKYIISIKYKEV